MDSPNSQKPDHDSTTGYVALLEAYGRNRSQPSEKDAVKTTHDQWQRGATGESLRVQVQSLMTVEELARYFGRNVQGFIVIARKDLGNRMG